MSLPESNGPQRPGSGDLHGQDPFTAGDALLARAKSVSQRIAERVRRLAEDTQADHPALPSDPTDEQPALP